MQKQAPSRRVVITGGSGLLALNWATACRADRDVLLGLHRHKVNLGGVSYVDLNLASVEALLDSFAACRPDVVVHTAGIANVDACEDDRQNAHFVNAELAGNVAMAAARYGAKLIHISTDHLFAGETPLRGEEDPPKPLNAYAESKLAGEALVARHNPEALIVRTNFFGWGSQLRRSFSDWILDGARQGRELVLFDDAFFNPVLAGRLAELAHALSDAGARGIVNVAGDDRVSKYEFAIRLLTAFGEKTEGVRRGSIQQSGLRAKRPQDLSLGTARLKNLLGHSAGRLDDFIHRLKTQEQQGLSTELFNAVTE